MVVIVPLPIAALRRQNEIVAAFRAAGATRPERAATLAALEVHEGMALRIMRRHEMVRDAGGDRVYLDERRWEAREARRHRIAWTILSAILLVLGVAALWALSR